jgi:hypothetical protein
MRPPTRSLDEIAAVAILACLLVAVLLPAFAATTVIGGGLGFAVGLTVGLGAGQVLRRPAGRAIGRLVDA